MSSPSEIKGFFDECVLLAEQSRLIRERFAAMQRAATLKKIGWQELKSLAIANDADQHEKKEGKRDRVSKLMKKSEYTRWYADILKLATKDEQVTVARSSAPTTPDKPITEPVARAPLQREGDGEPAAGSLPHPPDTRGASRAGSADSEDEEPNPQDDIRTQSFYRPLVGATA